MRAFASATLPGLVLHNVRIAWRARTRGKVLKLVALGLYGVYVIACVLVALTLRDMPIGPTPAAMTVACLAALVLLSFGLSQALSRAEQTLYGSGDLDLLLSAPIATRTVLWSKLIGIAATVLTSEALFILPPLLPVIVLGHAALAGTLVLIVAIVLVATCLGLAVMLTIVRLAGPRAARTVAQVMIALFGGAIVLSSQVLRLSGAEGGRNGFGLLFAWAAAHRLGQAGLAGMIGRAAFCDPMALALCALGAVVLFAVTGLLFERHFITAFQQSGQNGTTRPGRHPTPRPGMRARFTASLVRAMLAKELALLRRNPQVLATMLLRLVYLAPLLLVVLQQSQGIVLPSVAFVGVFVTTQLTGDLAWLVISGEDTPDLLAVAPIAKTAIGRAKAEAAVLMATPLIALVAAPLAWRAPLLVLVVVPLALGGSVAAASIQLALERPTPRKNFGRRTKGASIAANSLVMLVALILGGLSAGAAWWLTPE